MAQEITELSFDDFGFSTTETIQEDMASSFSTANPEEVTEIKIEPTLPKEELTPELLDTLETTTEEVIEEEDPVIEDEPKVNPIKAFSGVLADEGIISLEEGEEIEDGEQLLIKIREEGQKAAVQEFEGILSRFGPEYREAFRAIFQSGVNPREYYQILNKLESVRELDLEEEDNQELILRQAFKQQGLSDARIKSRIQGFKDLGSLQEEATEAHQLLLKAEEENLFQLEQEKLQQQQLVMQQENFYRHSIGQLLNQKLTAKEVDGVPLNKKDADFIYDDLTTKKWKLPNGEELTDFDKWLLDLKRPENYELRLKIAALRRLDFDLTKVAKKEVSKALNNKFDFLAQKEKTAVRTNTKTNSPFNNL